MSTPSIESKIRRLFPILRFVQAYVPLRLKRWVIRQGRIHLNLPEGVKHEAVSADGVACVWLIPQNSPKVPTLLYLHGGGFILGLTAQHLAMVAYLTQKMGIRTLLVDYRLAPEHPFPAALDDCVTAYRWLLNQGISAQQVAIAGDSAGGNLAIAAMMKLRDSGEKLPAAAAFLSPVANLSDHGHDFIEFKDPLIPPKAGKIYRTSYIGHNDARNPLISPANGDWHGLPPLLIHAGEDERLRFDALRIEELAKTAGVDVQKKIFPRMWHVWQINLQLPQASQSLDEIAQFLSLHLGLGAQ